MNELVIKRAIIFSLILGATIGLIALLPTMIGICLFALSFLSSVIVIMYMKLKENFFPMLDTQQGAILGGIIGFFAGIGYFAAFAPMVFVLHLIFKSYYSYAIPYIIQDAFWLFLVIIFMIAIMFATTNAASAMGVAYIINKLSQKPENYDAPLDIKIED